MNRHHKTFGPGLSLLGVGLLAAVTLLSVPEAEAQRRGHGSVRHSSASRTTVTRGGASRTTVSRTTRHAGVARRPVARPPAARPPAARPPARTGRAGYRAGYRHGHHHGRYSAWEDARRDYYRYRTINNLIYAGAKVLSTPKQTTTVVVTGTTYYYAGGVYYVKSGTSCVVVNPPPGAVVYAVPTATTVVYVDSKPYYYYGGTYYVVTDKPAEKPPAEATATADASREEAAADSDQTTADAAEAPEIPPMSDGEENYEVVGPPVGATVPYVPDEADEETIDGKKYFVFEGTYYRPFTSDGDTVYMVVEDPRQEQEQG